MIRETIDNAIKNESGITITYSKDGEKSNCFHLCTVAYSEKYGNNYIVGYCYDHAAELTFKIDKIIHAEIEWIDVLSKSANINKDGLYLMAIRGDMCLGFKLLQFTKEEWARHILDIIHRDDDTLAFHHIPYLEEDKDGRWIPYDNMDIELKEGIYTIAFTLVDNQGTKEENDECRFCSEKHNGINYAVVEIWKYTSIEDLKISKNIEVLAYNYCTFYNEGDHKSHWDLVRKMGLI